MSSRLRMPCNRIPSITYGDSFRVESRVDQQRYGFRSSRYSALLKIMSRAQIEAGGGLPCVESLNRGRQQDDPHDRQKAFQPYNCEILEAENGSGPSRRDQGNRAHHPHITMPVMNGVEMLTG
jgi:hypothetical protein